MARATNPDLSSADREALVGRLMAGRRAVARAQADNDPDALAAARGEVEAAKVGLGERGPVWWTDGVPDLNRHMARNTPYEPWFAALGPPDGRVTT